MLDSFDSLSFFGLHCLHVLNLSQNNIQIIISNGFTGLTNLENLDLTNNEITYLSGDAFAPLTSLKTIRPHSLSMCCVLIHQTALELLHCLQPSCDQVFIGFNLQIMALFIGGVVMVCNGIAFIFVLSGISKSDHPSTIFPVLFLINCDAMIAIYLFIVSWHAQYYGAEFQFYRNLWIRSIGCIIAQSVSTFALTGSTMSVMVIVLQWYLLVHSPFKAGTLIKKYWVFFCGYIIFPITISCLQNLLLVVGKGACFMSDSDINDRYSVSILVGIHCILMIVCMIIISLSIMIIIMTERSRVSASRARSLSDVAVITRITMLCIITLTRMTVFASLLTVNLIQTLNNLTEWIVIMLVPLNALVQPFIFTKMNAIPSIIIQRTCIRTSNKNGGMA